MKKGQALLSFVVGFSAIFLMALTTDQIIQKVYDSGNTAFRVNMVAGSGGGAAPTGCSIAGGVLSCVSFTSTESTQSVATPVYGTPHFVMWESDDTDLEFSLTGNASQSLDIGLYTDQTNLGVYDPEGNQLVVAKVASTGGGATLDDIAGTGYLETYTAATTDLIFISRQGKLRFAAGGNALSNEAWDVDTSGNLVSVGTERDITFNGKITSSRTSDLGWTVQAAANQACNTTCTSACVVGFDSGSSNLPVACTDATADVCLCAGAS